MLRNCYEEINDEDDDDDDGGGGGYTIIQCTIRFIGVWQPKAGLNIIQYRYNSTHKKHIVQEMSYGLLIMCKCVGNGRILKFVSLRKNQRDLLSRPSAGGFCPVTAAADP